MKRAAPCSKSVDPFELANRFSNDQAINYSEMRDSNVDFDSDLMPFLSYLPPREADLLELYYKYRKNQKDIARLFGVTQGAVSSRITRAKKRLKYIVDRPKIGDNELESSLNGLFSKLEIEIIKCMMQTTCQSKTAMIINDKFGLNDQNRMTQVKIRHRFEKCLITLKEAKSSKPELTKYWKLLEFIKSNLYMLHEVKLPHFDRGDFAVFSLNN